MRVPKFSIGLVVTLFVLAGCTEPTGPDASPVVPPVVPPVAVDVDWSRLRVLLADSFQNELPERLSNAPRGVLLKSASTAAVEAIDAKDLTRLKLALDRIGSESSEYRALKTTVDEDLIFLDVIDDVRILALEWLGTA